MIAELEAALGEDGLFRPYLQARKDRPSYDFHGLLDNPAWSTLYLWENGGPVEGARFPKTFAALGEVPLPHVSTRAPSILFSLLKPGARIAPHHGMINTRLICHLPLIVPEKCGFRVGNEVREWEVGKLLIFDDTIEHEPGTRATGPRRPHLRRLAARAKRRRAPSRRRDLRGDRRARRGAGGAGSKRRQKKGRPKAAR